MRATETAAKTPPTKAAFAELNELIVAALEAQFALGLRTGRDPDLYTPEQLKATRRENRDAMRAMFAALHAMTVRAAPVIPATRSGPPVEVLDPIIVASLRKTRAAEQAAAAAAGRSEAGTPDRKNALQRWRNARANRDLAYQVAAHSARGVS